ncbi:MAG: cell division protein SepF [Ruminococcaceae bacterium]|nr:cell division protein SepF [Oscillospiraceae bacterium]
MGLREFGKKLFPDAIEADDNYAQDIYDDVEEQYQEDDRNVRTSDSYGSRGIGISTGGSSIEMKVVTPKSYDTVTQIADLLLAKKTVLLNLESTNRETARRLIDFLSGVAYALGGGVQKVADNTYAITPSNVAVSKENIGGVAASAAPEADNSSAF